MFKDYRVILYMSSSEKAVKCEELLQGAIDAAAEGMSVAEYYPFIDVDCTYSVYKDETAGILAMIPYILCDCEEDSADDLSNEFSFGELMSVGRAGDQLIIDYCGEDEYLSFETLVNNSSDIYSFDHMEMSYEYDDELSEEEEELFEVDEDLSEEDWDEED